MRRIRLTIAYDGTDFYGWQVQPELPTVQGILEAIFEGIEKKPVHVAGSGRTDAGVHAAAQIGAVTLENPIPLANLRKAVNRLLPQSIRLLDASEAEAAFHPRFDAVSKTYEYRTFLGEICSPFERRYTHHHPYVIDTAVMAEISRVFEGTHDFGAFAASDDRDTEQKSQVRTIFSSRLEERGGRLVYRVTGSGFLKHMVRNIMGTLIEAGKGSTTADQLRNLFVDPVKKAGPTAPACGLHLIGVEYPPGSAAASTDSVAV